MAEIELADDTTWYVKERLPCRWMRIDLQSRDLKLLQVLLEQKFLSLRQIQDHFFEGKERYTYLRVWKLRRFRLIRRLWAGFIKEGIYLATETAHEYFKSLFLEVPIPLSLPDARTLSHDLLVTEVRFLFEKIGFGLPWTSERVWRMKRSAKLWAPDALLLVEGDAFALEIECVQKMDRRYEDIFSRYEEDTEIAGCLYVTTESLVGNLMKRAQGFTKIYFTTEKDLFEKKEKTVFRNASGKLLSIEENRRVPLMNLEANGD